jgi:hypothetical protein
LVETSVGFKRKIIPQDTDRTGVKHQGKRELHGISKPALGESTKEMAMSNEYNIAMLLAMHVATVNVTDLCNEIINAVGDLLGRSAEDELATLPSSQIHDHNHIGHI